MIFNIPSQSSILSGIKWKLPVIIPLLILSLPFISMCFSEDTTDPIVGVEMIELPEPSLDGEVSVEQAILTRRSIRNYQKDSLMLAEASQLLWAAQGFTSDDGKRAAPSAGALYPLEVYIVSGEVSGLRPGVYKYVPEKHALSKVINGDKRKKLCGAALSQPCVENAALTLVFTAVYERTTKKYKERGKQYVHMEVGHAAQNVYLQSVSLQLGTVVVGAFHDTSVKKVLGIPENEEPLCIMPVGRFAFPD